jgi:hypothetical protein
MQHPIAKMNRFLSRREKDGSSHRRDKSRDKIAEKEKKDEKKVLCLPIHSVTLRPLMLEKLSRSSSVLSLSAAFPNPQGKAAPLLQTFYSTVHGTKANTRPSLLRQIRPLSGDGILSLFKTDKNESQEPLKGPDTTRSTKVKLLLHDC